MSISIALIGSGGMVGSDFDRSKVIPLTRKDVDITSYGSVADCLDRIQPDVVINCAGITDIVGCENNRKKAFDVNVFGAVNLAFKCARNQIKLIHVSTVHSGDSNIYTLTKYMTEQAFGAYFKNHAVVRLPWIFSKNNDKKFLATVLLRLKSGMPIEIYDNEIGSPTYAKDVADYLVDNCMNLKGIIDIANTGSATRREWTLEIAKIRGIDFDRVKFIPIQRSIPMKEDSRVIGILRPWREALRDCLT